MLFRSFWRSALDGDVGPTKLALGTNAHRVDYGIAADAADSGWEQAQNSLAKATLRNGGDYFPFDPH